jgi:hypothetical protein
VKIKEEGLGSLGGGRRFSPSADDGKKKKKKVVRRGIQAARWDEKF